MTQPLWEGRPNAPKGLWAYRSILTWIAIPLWLLGLIVLLIARANWAEVEGAGMVWLLAFFIAGPMAIGAALFPGAAMMERSRRRKTTYSVTQDGAQISGHNYPITVETPIKKFLKGPRSVVTFRDPVRRQVRVHNQTTARRTVTTAAVGFYHLTEDEARAAEAALLVLRDRSG